MKKMILMTIFFCSFANGMRLPKPVIDLSNTQKVYCGLAKSDQDKQQFLSEVVPGVCVLPSFKVPNLIDATAEQVLNTNNIQYSTGTQNRFNSSVSIEDSKELVKPELTSSSPCDISSFVNSFGTKNIRCIIGNADQNTCTSKLVAPHTLAMNFLHACKDNNAIRIRGILSYVNQEQARAIVKEAQAILRPEGLENFKKACNSDTLHFRGIKVDTQSFLKLFNNAPQKTQQTKTTDWNKSWWFGGGLAGIAAVIGIYLLFIRNK